MFPYVPSMSPDVVGFLGIQVLHENGHRTLELDPSSWGAFERRLLWITLRKQGPKEGVLGLPHGLGQVPEEQVVILVDEAVHVVGHLYRNSTWSGQPTTLSVVRVAPPVSLRSVPGSHLPPVPPPLPSACAQALVFTLQPRDITLPA